jgi:hypothetical protein
VGNHALAWRSRYCRNVRLADAYGEYLEPDWPGELRCGDCGKLLAKLVNAPFRVMCPDRQLRYNKLSTVPYPYILPNWRFT